MRDLEHNGTSRRARNRFAQNCQRVGPKLSVLEPPMYNRKHQFTWEEIMRVLMSLAIALAATTALGCTALAQETTDEGTIDPRRSRLFSRRPGYSPYAGNSFPIRPLFGDTHLHTSQSFDAIAFGNSLGPEEAYRFARGEEVTSSTGQRARLSRPLDFLVVADHAENMGTLGEIKAGNPALMDDPQLKRWNQMLGAGSEQAMNVYYEIMASVGGR